MITQPVQRIPPTCAPLCKTHFESYVLEHITHLLESKKSKTTKKRPEPTRVQPRRAAKDSHILAKAKRKRDTDQELTKSEAKRRKTDNSAQNSTKWKAFSKAFEQQVDEIAGKAREERFGDCPFGPTPWTCHLCTSEIAKSTDGMLLTNEEPGAPVADMSPIGCFLEVNLWDGVWLGELEFSHCEGLSYILDACGEPRFMFL
ncbi:Ff.00g044580.m01.CDS01 [Fusarium sp. VM40]|nr:Ff.00g044580.m01.CDS01 [Fusarium sp. VM40]